MVQSDKRRKLVPRLITGVLVVAAGVVAVLLIIPSASAQTAKPLGVVWDKTFGGPKGDAATSIIALPDGGFAVTGGTQSKGAGGADAFVLRLDHSGRIVWDKTFGGPNADDARSIVALPDGGFAVAGVTASRGAGGYDARVLRLDDKGQLMWDKTFGGPESDWALSIVALPDGGFAVAGSTVPKGANRMDAWVLRLDGTGKILWNKTFGGQKDDWASSIAALPDGGFAVAGWTASKGAGEEDAWVLRLDSTGRAMWDKTFGGPKRDSVGSIVTLPDGGFVLAGSTYSKSAGEDDVWVLRLDGAGRLLWDKTFGGPKRDFPQSIVALPDGGFAVAGHTGSKGAGNYDAWVLRLDGSGRMLWDKVFGGPKSDGAVSIVALPDGGLAVAGQTQSKGAGSFDAWVLRLGRASAK